MKQLLFYCFSLLLVSAAQAAPGPLPAESKASFETKMTKAGTVQFQFANIGGQSDSMLIIFDRHDHTGAGVVYQVFATDSTQGITIPAVPAGKYYVTIQCKGLHRDRVEKLVTIKAKKNEKVRIQLSSAEAFSRNDVVIPAFRPSFSDMATLRSKSK